MSKVIEFWEKIDSDSDLQKEFKSYDTNLEIIDFAQRIGFDFTIEDYEKELESSLDLGKISGGAAMDSGITQCPSHWPTSPSE